MLGLPHREAVKSPELQGAFRLSPHTESIPDRPFFGMPRVRIFTRKNRTATFKTPTAAGIAPDRPIRSMEKIFFLGDQTETDRIVSSLSAAAFTSIAGPAGIFVGVP